MKLTKAQNEMLVDILTYGTMRYDHRARRTASVLAAEGLVRVQNVMVPAGSNVMRKGILVEATEAFALKPEDFEVDPDSEFSDWKMWAP